MQALERRVANAANEATTADEANAANEANTANKANVMQELVVQVNIKTLKVTELKDYLRLKGKPVSGRKEQLVSRLMDAVGGETFDVVVNQRNGLSREERNASGGQNASGGGNGEMAVPKWVVIQPTAPAEAIEGLNDMGVSEGFFFPTNPDNIRTVPRMRYSFKVDRPQLKSKEDEEAEQQRRNQMSNVVDDCHNFVVDECDDPNSCLQFADNSVDSFSGTTTSDSLQERTSIDEEVVV